MIVAFAGGVGGAKLALGLAQEPAGNLMIVVNTGDDFVHMGLHISPDVDTVTYTLAGIANPIEGWGVVDETWSFMQMMERLGGETWFRLGDRDLATHVWRSRRLAEGIPLSAVTLELCKQLGVPHPVYPMTDAAVRTIVMSGGARIAFQDYFVRRKCAPVVDSIVYEGAAMAQPPAAVMAALTGGSLEGIVICPSNPYLSIAPMLAIPALRRALENRSRPALAVAPIIGGKAVKGPAAKIMRELGRTASCIAVAEYYRGLIDYLVIDRSDADSADAIRALAIEPVVADILMRTLEDRIRLARECLAILRRA